MKRTYQPKSVIARWNTASVRECLTETAERYLLVEELRAESS